MIWSEYIQSLGPYAVFLMLMAGIGFIGVFLGLRQFRWDKT